MTTTRTPTMAAPAAGTETVNQNVCMVVPCNFMGKSKQATNQPMPVGASFDRAARKVPVAVWIGVAVVALVAVVAGLSRGSTNRRPTLKGQALTAARSLLQSAAQMATQAQQDLDPTQRAKDVHFALAYINAARNLAPDDVLQARCGVNVTELFAVVRAQEAALAPGPLSAT